MKLKARMLSFLTMQLLPPTPFSTLSSSSTSFVNPNTSSLGK
ncbi:hypothetical protein EGR_11164 [Echinococcus granulosus]|uniref:Uncharacterized protein n=1 Tax=Echinococcus granulosus TaxID=6210 RepID=W6UKG7_ECHGR|nr:hypothetical protein EGR_11164 [Echinococcus granulosus]EUB53979.1 hypothetical protein EGR_11164 [Echinococcus granulosus]